MGKGGIEDLSEAEMELLLDFVEWVGEFDRQVLDKQTIEGDPSEIGLEEVFEYLVPYVSDVASEFDAQMFRLFRLEQEIKSRPVFEYENEDELPSDATVTPGELNRFLKKDEIEEFFLLASQMIESLSVDLVMQEVVDPARRSDSIRERVSRKSQSEREWLLYVAGVISDGQKGELRRVYDFRSTIVHNSDNPENILRQINIPSDVERAKSAINSLHEEIYGIEMKHRFGDLIA